MDGKKASELEISYDEDDFRLIDPAVPQAVVGLRLDTYLSRHFPFLSRAAWQKKIAANELFVNHQPVRPSYKVRLGDSIKHYMPAVSEPTVDRRIKILWQDDDVLCAYKPPGLPMHESGAYRKNTFREILKELVGKEWDAVHRLDRETSGVVLCAGSEAAKANLCKQLEEKKIEKQYLAIVSGRMVKEKWSVDVPIENIRDQQIRQKKPTGKTLVRALTDFEVIESRTNFLCLRAYPRTGRTNQIRIHAAHCGLALVGDKIFGGLIFKAPGLERLCLHAEKISFFHPRSGVQTHCESTMPDDMRRIWQEASLMLGSAHL